MKRMNIENKLDLLKQINQVEAPPFLLTRIRHQIQNLGNVEAPVKWKWGFAVTFILIIAFNISILFQTTTGVDKPGAKSDGIENVISSMNLSNSNDLYHE